jgi:hypothetical protein
VYFIIICVGTMIIIVLPLSQNITRIHQLVKFTSIYYVPLFHLNIAILHFRKTLRICKKLAKYSWKQTSTPHILYLFSRKVNLFKQPPPSKVSISFIILFYFSIFIDSSFIFTFFMWPR